MAEASIKTRSIFEMKGFLSQFGFDRQRGFSTPLVYSPRMGEIRGEQKGFNPELRAFELALLTIQENGSAPEGYKSVSDARPIQVALAVGAYNSNDEGLLIVSDLIDPESSHLIHPAKLSLKHIIGYESLRRF